jgi:PST family polysaccharide transporter
LIIVAEPLVRVVYGEQWLPAVAPMQLLVLFGLLRVMAGFAGYLFEGIGQPGVGFYVAGVRLAVLLPLIVPATIYFGLMGAAATVVAGMAAQWISGLPALKKHLGISLGALLRLVWRPVWTSSVMAAVAISVMAFVDAERLLGLLLTILAAAAAYGALNLKMILALRRTEWS